MGGILILILRRSGHWTTSGRQPPVFFPVPTVRSIEVSLRSAYIDEDGACIQQLTEQLTY